MSKQSKPATPAVRPSQHAPGAGPVATATVAPATPAPEKVKRERYAKGPFAQNGVITLLVNSNPKRPTGKSYHRFALHKSGQTVADYVKAVTTAEGAASAKSTVALADIRWDVAAGFIAVANPPEPAKS